MFKLAAIKCKRCKVKLTSTIQFIFLLSMLYIINAENALAIEIRIWLPSIMGKNNILHSKIRHCFFGISPACAFFEMLKFIALAIFCCCCEFPFAENCPPEVFWLNWEGLNDILESKILESTET